MKLFTRFGGRGLVLDTFYNGYNSVSLGDYMSLKKIATESTFTHTLPFQNYYESDSYVSDLLDILLSSDEDAPPLYDEKALFASKLVQYMVMYIAPLDHMQLSVRSCLSGREDPTTESWDVAAAYLIRSQEGTLPGGSSIATGFSIYSALKETCQEFNTCHYLGGITDDGSVVKILNDGKEYAAGLSCEALANVIEVLTSIMQAALIQSTIYYSILIGDESLPSFKGLADYSDQYTDATLLNYTNTTYDPIQIGMNLDGVAGLAAVMSVAPLVKQADRKAVKELVDYIDGVNGHHDVVDTFQTVVPKMANVNCLDEEELKTYGNFCADIEDNDNVSGDGNDGDTISSTSGDGNGTGGNNITDGNGGDNSTFINSGDEDYDYFLTEDDEFDDYDNDYDDDLYEVCDNIEDFNYFSEQYPSVNVCESSM